MPVFFWSDPLNFRLALSSLASALPLPMNVTREEVRRIIARATASTRASYIDKGAYAGCVPLDYLVLGEPAIAITDQEKAWVADCSRTCFVGKGPLGKGAVVMFSKVSGCGEWEGGERD